MNFIAELPIGTSLSFEPLPKTFTNPMSKNKFWIERFIDKTRLTLYIEPGSSQASNYINIYYVKRIQDAGITHPNAQAKDGAYTFATDVPYRFFSLFNFRISFLFKSKT